MILRHLILAVLAPLASLNPSYSPFAQASSFTQSPLTGIDSVTDARFDSRSDRVSAYSSFQLSFHAFKRRMRLDLEPNHDILPEGAEIHYLGADGQVERKEPIDRHLHKVYMGNVYSQNVDGQYNMVGHARITVHQDGKKPVFEGAFSIRNEHHHILLRNKYLATKDDLDPEPVDNSPMVVFRDGDRSTQEHALHEEFRKRNNWEADHGVACPSDQLEFNTDLEHPVYSTPMTPFHKNMFGMPESHLFRRQLDTSSGPGNSAGVNLVSTIGQTSGCPTTRKVALVGVATDCTYTASFSSNEEVSKNIIAQLNSASALYEKTFNISLGLQNMSIQPKDCPGQPPSQTPWNVPCDGGVDIQQRLNLFSQWRGRQNDNNAFWTLLTTCKTGPAVGLAWLGQSCVISADARNATSGGVQTVSGANVVAKTQTEWQVIAHEVGHTFGAVHDCTSQTCSDGTATKQMCCPLSGGTCDAGQKYIMNPSTATGIDSFSLCSIGNICSAFGRNSVKTSCFSSNRGVPLITAAQCGNGIVETGEDCDCGGTVGCADNPCCDGATCKFRGSAVCDDSNEECCRNCKFAPANTVCRSSTGECDPEERCGGTNATCPGDVRAPDGKDCGKKGDDMKCASGHCTSRDYQCKTLMGSYGGGNTTYACDPYVCTLSCSSPALGPNTCMTMNQNFLDGTECGGGGHCQNGQCRDSSFAKEIKSWIDKHKPIVIGVASGAGALILLMILSCCCSRYKRKKASKKAAAMWPGPTGARGQNGNIYVPQPPAYDYGNGAQEWQGRPGMRQQNSWRYG